MALPYLYPHPVGWQNPEVMRVWAALPAANAWDAAPLVVPCAGAWWMRFYITYQRPAGLPGSLQYYYDQSPFSADALAPNEAWFHGTIYAAGNVIPCVTTQSNVQQEEITFCPTSQNAETFISPPIHLAGCIERLRVFCRQRPGSGATPGNAEVIGLFYVGG